MKSAIEILLVEDNENDIELTLHALRSENLGHQIHVVRDGEEALQCLANCEAELAANQTLLPKLILLDLKLPKIDGLQAAADQEHSSDEIHPGRGSDVL